VGIGTTSPAYNLDVGGSAAFGTGSEAMRIDTTGNVGIGTSTPYATLSILNNTSSLVDIFAIATSTSGGIVFKVDSYGRTYGDGAYASPAADYAEYFKTKSQNLQSGETVCVDMVENNSVKRCERGADNNVMGIVSTKPSVIGNYTKAAEADPAHYAIIGMMGQVEAFVSAENGAINVGDSLTSASSTPGYAMRANGGDSTVGIALEPFNGTSSSTTLGTGKIKVLISRRNKSLAVEEVESLVIDRIAEMKIEDRTQQLVKEAIDKIALTRLSVSGAVFAGSFVVENQMGTVSTSSPQATFPSAVLTADGKGIDVYKLATYNLSSITALSEKVGAHEMRLTALEKRVDALESGAISTTSTTTSMFSTSTLASAFEGLGAFISKGFAQFGTLIADRFVAATNSAGSSSAGTVTILAGNTVAQVNNAYVLPSSKVFVTFTASTTGSWFISDKQNGSFRIILSAPQAGDVSFDYFLIQTEGQIATSTPISNDQFPISNGNANANDTTPPVITLLGDNPVHISVGGEFIEPGVNVTDNAGLPNDCSLSNTRCWTTYVNGIKQEANADTITTGTQTTYIITYEARDAAGNSATARRSVIVGNPDGAASNESVQHSVLDTTAPIVTLNGSAAMQFTATSTPFADPGAAAADETDGTIAPVVTGAVDSATPGLYTLTYTATDAAGNVGTASRVVTVVAVAAAPATGAATSTPAAVVATSTPATP